MCDYKLVWNKNNNRLVQGSAFHNNSVPFLNKLSLEVLTQIRIDMQKDDFRTTEKKAVQNIKICQE